MKYLIIFAALITLGCSSTSNHVGEYRSLASSVKSSSIPGSRLSKAPQVTLGQQLEGEISKEDPMFLNAGYAANYDSYKFSIASPGEYHINIQALCDCLGFSKTLFYPSVHVFDQDLNEMFIDDSSIESKQQTNNFIKANLPARLDANWTLTLVSAGTYYLVISPYNKNIDTSAFNVGAGVNVLSGGMSIPVARLSLPLTIHPYGKYLALVEKSNLL